MFDWSQILRHGLFAVVMGTVAAGASIVLCLAVGQAFALTQAFGWLIYLLPVAGVLSLLLYRWWRLPLDTTTRTVVDDIRHDRPISPLLAPGILVGTCLSIVAGGSVGKEAGALHMGASLGDLVARPFKLRGIVRDQAQPSAAAASGAPGEAPERRDREAGMHGYAAALGMAATFSALFFAPLGSAMFVLELTRYGKATLKHLASILLACFVAFALARLVGIGDVIATVPIPAPSWHLVGECVVIGAACALVGTAFIKSIDWLQRNTRRASRNYYLWVVAGGLLVAGLTLAFGWQPYEGTGGVQLAWALQGSQPELGFLVKALLTTLCLGLWFKGGEIMPTFAIGALLGASCTIMTGGEPGISAAIGLVAFFAAMSRCPLAALLMGCEIFGWAAAPLFALAVAVSFALGHDVGLYGRGATGALYHGAKRALGRLARNRALVVSAQADQVAQGAREAAASVSGREVEEGLQRIHQALSQAEEAIESVEAKEGKGS